MIYYYQLCEYCDEPTGISWYIEAYGLCGVCLAKWAVPLTLIPQGFDQDSQQQNDL